MTETDREIKVIGVEMVDAGLPSAFVLRVLELAARARASRTSCTSGRRRRTPRSAVARRAGMPQPSLSRLLNAMSELRPATLGRLADALGLPLAALSPDAPEPPRAPRVQIEARYVPRASRLVGSPSYGKHQEAR